MHSALKELMSRFPPPTDLSCHPVNWKRLEQHVDFSFPVSFKEYVDVYGGCIWFDDLSLIISQGVDEEQATEYVNVVNRKIAQVDGETYDEEFNEIQVSFFPEKKGLFPFLLDYSGNLYLWSREFDNPEEWPVVKSHAGWMKTLKAMTIPEMIIGWLNGDQLMQQVWGDVSGIDPERLGITEV